MTVVARIRATLGLLLTLAFVVTWPGASGAAPSHFADASASIDHASMAMTSHGHFKEATPDHSHQAKSMKTHGCAPSGPTDDGSSPSCCASACHAAMVGADVVLGVTEVRLTARATFVEPSIVAGPTLLLKRPPRPSPARIG